MNGEHTIHLNNVVRTPRTRKANRALFAIRQFVRKHTHVRPEEIRLAAEVNEAVWERGMNHKINRLNVVLRKKDGLVHVFTPNSESLKQFEKVETKTKEKTTKKTAETETKTPEKKSSAKTEEKKETKATPKVEKPKAVEK